MCRRGGEAYVYMLQRGRGVAARQESLERVELWIGRVSPGKVHRVCALHGARFLDDTVQGLKCIYLFIRPVSIYLLSHQTPFEHELNLHR